MSAKLPLSNPLLLGAVPGMVQDPKVLGMLTSTPASRPLDQNGIDVYGELPVMRRAYEKTMYGNARGGRAEARYSIFSRGEPGLIGHSGFDFTGVNPSSYRVPANTIALVHTHPNWKPPTPSGEDMDSPIPNYVFSGNKLYATVPGTQRYNEYDITSWNSPALQGLSR